MEGDSEVSEGDEQASVDMSAQDQEDASEGDPNAKSSKAMFNMVSESGKKP